MATDSASVENPLQFQVVVKAFVIRTEHMHSLYAQRREVELAVTGLIEPGRPSRLILNPGPNEYVVLQDAYYNKTPLKMTIEPA